MNDQKHIQSIMCPQCNAPLNVHRFGLSITCQYCGANIRLSDAAISAEHFRKALRAWNTPENYGISTYISLGDSHWALNREIGQGESTKVYTAVRARFPTELAIIKISNSQTDTLLKNEWNALTALQRSNAPGAEFFSRLIPQPIEHGEITGSNFKGQHASIFRWRSGFHHNLEKVRQTYPQGIEARASIWVWRRMLEMLAFIHASGRGHGAVLPPHLLVQENDHGIALVGYSRSGLRGEKLRSIPHGYETYYAKETRLTEDLDLSMSARSLIYALGGNPATADLPKTVPTPFAQIIQRVALSKAANEDAWSIRTEIGKIADQVYGAPKFMPIPMP